MKNYGQFFKEVRLELSKVTWPSFRELVGTTIIVLIIVFVFAVYLGLIDFVFSRVARQLFLAYGLR